MAVMYVFAAIGVEAFAKGAYNNSYNEHTNFRYFGVAMLTLLRCMTGKSKGIP